MGFCKSEAGRCFNEIGVVKNNTKVLVLSFQLVVTSFVNVRDEKQKFLLRYHESGLLFF